MSAEIFRLLTAKEGRLTVFTLAPQESLRSDSEMHEFFHNATDCKDLGQIVLSGEGVKHLPRQEDGTPVGLGIFDVDGEPISSKGVTV